MKAPRRRIYDEYSDLCAMVESMKRGTALLSAEITLASLGCFLTFADLADHGQYLIVVPTSVTFLTSAVVCGMMAWKSQSRVARSASVVAIVLCALMLPDLIFRRLPSTLANPHVAELQQLLASASKAGLEHNYPQAEQFYKKIVEGEKSGRFVKTPSSNNELALAEILENEAKFAESEEAYQQALVLARAAWGPASEYCVAPLKGLARVNKQEKKFKEAEDAYKLALSINEQNRQKQKSWYYDRTAKEIYTDYAKLLRETGRARQAQAMEEQAAQ